MDDVLAVMDAAGSESAALVGVSDGGPLAAVMAATYPDRVAELVLVNTYSRRIRSHDYPWGPSAEEWQAFQDEIQQQWGKPVFAEILAPSMTSDSRFMDWWATFLRQSVSPGGAVAILRMNALVDIRAVLDAIHQPTLILHRRGDLVNPVEGARFMAERIPQARLVEMDGDDHHPWNGDAEAMLGELERFITGQIQTPTSRTVLATLLFTDIVQSTRTAADMGDRRWGALLDTHHGVVRSTLDRYQGRPIKTTGDGFLALFDGPARAVRCGLAVRDKLADVGINIRAGVHTSEIEMVDGDVRGIGVHLAARVMSLAGAGEVLVSSVVRDLSVGSGLEFADRGRHEMKGIPGEWQVLSGSDPTSG